MKNKNSWQLRAFCAAAKPLLFLLLATSCTPSDDFSTTCPSGDCDAGVVFPVQPDENGYYHVKLDWTREYLPYFSVDAYAEPTSPEYHYNDSPFVTARFDSNLIWTIGDTLVMPDYYYNPFGSDRTSSGTVLPSEKIEVILSQFRGTKVNIAQNTEIYFSDKGDSKLYTKRVLGPFPPESIGDTITLYMEVFWDAGIESQVKDHYNQKFIVE